jgi:hypothetical protein
MILDREERSSKASLLINMGTIVFGTVRPLPRKRHIFRWRNYLRARPLISQRPDSPMRILNTKSYAYASLGSSIGTELVFDVENSGEKPIHSFATSHWSPISYDVGSSGTQPAPPLAAGQKISQVISTSGKTRLTLTTQFVQYLDGSVCYSHASDSPVKPRGVQAGLQAAADHLLGVFEREGAASVMETLPKIHVYVGHPMSPPDLEFGIFGFYSGVTRASVFVEHVYRHHGVDAIGLALTQISQEGKP